jgi:hypothetical protein
LARPAAMVLAWLLVTERQPGAVRGRVVRG